MFKKSKRKMFLCIGVLLTLSFGLIGCNTSAPLDLLTVSGVEIQAEPMTASASGLQYFNNTYEGFSQGEGYYRVTNNNNEVSSSRVSYIDFNSKVEIPLCNQPQCTHDTEKCQAIFYGDAYMRGQIFPMGDKIYVLAGKNTVTKIIDEDKESGMITANETFSNALYEINIDGTNRTELLEIGAEYEPHITVVTGNGKILISAVKLDDNSVVAEQVILQVDVSSRTLSELDIKGEICGVTEDSVVISQTGYGDLAGLSDSEAISIINKSNNTIVTYNIKTGESKEHGQVPDKNLILYYVYDNRLIYSPGRNVIYYLNLDTDETGIVTDQLPGRFYTSSEGDGKIVCSFDDGADMDAKITKCLTVDCETGATSDFTLFTRQSVDKHGVEIIAASDTKYVVKSDLIEKAQYIEWAGVNQVNLIGEKLALINKEDYWNCKENYEIITTLD